jgi:uncharacterized protein (TIGR03118 family)
LASGTSGGNNFLYAANFSTGKIDVFDKNFAKVTLAGNFTDINLPSGFAPFNVQNIGGKLYVTYAMQDPAKHDDVPGPGKGFVDVYDTSGNLLQRLVTQSALNSPWGLALAPSTFGQFANDLLVGNFGDGTINVFNPVTGTLLGTLKDLNGNTITNQGLWGLAFGNGSQGFDPAKLYFTAGIPGPRGDIEDHGLFASITAVPEPSTWITAAVGLLALRFLMARRSASV